MEQDYSRFLVKRKSSDSLSYMSTILFSVLAALAIGVIFILMIGKNPVRVYTDLLLSPFRSLAGFGQILRNATPLMIIGVGVALAGKCGVTNLGGDGQFFMGCLGMILVSIYWGEVLGPFSAVVGLLVGALFGALLGVIPGLFKAYFQTSEIITCLMLNYIVALLVSYLVNGPIKAPGSSLPQTQLVNSWEELPKIIPGTVASAGIFIALACIVMYWVIINKTNFGFNVKAVGGSRNAAEYCGLDARKYFVAVMLISGAFSGVAGMVEVCGNQHRLVEGLANGIGFDAMMISLLGARSPQGVFLAALLIGMLDAGGNMMQVTSGVPMVFVDVIKGLMMLFMLNGLGKERKFSYGASATSTKKPFFKKKEAAEPAPPKAMVKE